MAATSIFEIATNTTSITGGHGLKAYMALIGSPEVAMLISLLFAIWSMGLHQHRSMADINKIVGDSLKSIVMLLMIICGGRCLQAGLDRWWCWDSYPTHGCPRQHFTTDSWLGHCRYLTDCPGFCSRGKYDSCWAGHATHAGIPRRPCHDGAGHWGWFRCRISRE